MKVKEESEKVGLKLNIQKTKFMTSGPITSWQIDGETVEIYFFWAPESLQVVTAAMKLKDAYSLEEKLWPTNLDNDLRTSKKYHFDYKDLVYTIDYGRVSSLR